MSQVEDMLYAAHAQGKREELLKRAEKVRSAPQHKWSEQSDVYSKAWRELVKEGILSDTVS
jgi:hypothetical protein